MCDSQELYQRCTSTDLREVHAGFQELGRCLLPVIRKQLNQERFDTTVVEDCVQEALRNIWQNLQHGNGPQSPSTFWGWAITIAQRRGLDRIRYEGRRMTNALTDGMEETQLQSISSTANASLQLEAESLLVEQKVTLVLSIRNHPKISHNSKTILVDGFLFEKSDVELAQALLTTKGNIRLTRHRNLEKLRTDNDFLTNLRKLYAE